MTKENTLFVPGRLSLIGGLSDLVTPYLSLNDDLTPGMAIAFTLDKGIYSRAEKSNKLSYLYNGLYYECEMSEEALMRACKYDNYYSYICGTLLYLKQMYGETIGGIQLEIVEMDLPIKKGLSSSAAICVTVAKQMNKLYELNLSDEDIINIAYEGEHLAGSQCGMLDQTSIMNEGLSQIKFLEKRNEVKSLNAGEDIILLVVDLNSSKNTKKIMSFFNAAMSNPKEEENFKVYNFFKIYNSQLVESATRAIEEGDIERLGHAFNKFQEFIDSFGDSCDELKAPVLHSVLGDQYVKAHTYGGKGVGSGGDGTAMLICKDEEAMDRVGEYLKEEYDMDSINVHVKKKTRYSGCIK